MFSLFFKKKGGIEVPPEPKLIVPEGFLLPQTAEQLLATPRRQKLLNLIWQRTSVSREQFNLLYLKPIQRYAELVQVFPASESHHHAYHGGMIDHGLEVITYALKLRQSFLLPAGSSTEEQAAQGEVWTAGITYAAMLHDIGKIAVDLHVEQTDGQIWHPWQGTLLQPYRFKYQTDREYRLHTAASGLLYQQILDPVILNWLTQYPALWRSLLYLIGGQPEQAEILGEIINKADQASVAQELGGDPTKAITAPKQALQRKLLDGLRYLIKEQLKLNQSGPSDGWLTNDALWLVSKTVSDKLRAHLLSQGISGIPEKNTAIFDILQEHSIIKPTPEDKAIWNATVASESGWSHAFTLLKLSPSMIWESGNQPDAFKGVVNITQSEPEKSASIENPAPVQNETTPIISEPVQTADSLDSILNLFNVPQVISSSPEAALSKPEIAIEPVIQQTEPTKTVHQILPVVSEPEATVEEVQEPGTTETLSAEHFMTWLKTAILNQQLMINDPQALVHTVADTLFIVTPGIFMKYAMLHAGSDARWEIYQKQFEKLKLHRKTPVSGKNIWTCQIVGFKKTQKKLHGYLLKEPEQIIAIPFNNPHLSITDDSKIE